MSDPILPAETRKRPKKRFRILLGASLALNLLFIGAIAGAAFKGGKVRNGPSSMRVIAAPYVDAFDFESKRALRKEMRATLPPRREANAANNADYQLILEILRAEVFDQERASAVMEAQFERAGQFQRAGRNLSIARMSSMSFEQRTAYADRLQEHLEARKKRGKRKER